MTKREHEAIAVALIAVGIVAVIAALAAFGADNLAAAMWGL